jgi:hypothetical protein
VGEWNFIWTPASWSQSSPRFSTWAFAFQAFYTICTPPICITLYQWPSCWLLRLQIPFERKPQSYPPVDNCQPTIHQLIKITGKTSQSEYVLYGRKSTDKCGCTYGSQIACFAKVKSLGLMINQNLTWNDQINKICRNVFLIVKRLWPMVHFTPIKTRKKLVTSLIVPQFLYCDVVFSKTTQGLREKLKVAFNSCARYIYGVSRNQHI